MLSRNPEGSSPVTIAFLVHSITKNAILLKQEDLPSDFQILITDSELVPWGQGERELF